MKTVTVEDQTSAVVVSGQHLGECGLAWNPNLVVSGVYIHTYVDPNFLASFTFHSTKPRI